MNEDALAWQSKSGKQEAVLAKDIRSAAWVPLGRNFQLKLGLKGGTTIKFDGFRQQVDIQIDIENDRFCQNKNKTNKQDHEFFVGYFKETYKLPLVSEAASLRGWNWGEAKVNGKFNCVVEY